MKFNQRIGAWMHWAGITQAELARKIKQSQQSVSAWIIGPNEPRRGTLEKVVKVFGITMVQFYGDIPTEPKKPGASA